MIDIDKLTFAETPRLVVCEKDHVSSILQRGWKQDWSDLDPIEIKDNVVYHGQRRIKALQFIKANHTRHYNLYLKDITF